MVAGIHPAVRAGHLTLERELRGHRALLHVPGRLRRLPHYEGDQQEDRKEGEVTLHQLIRNMSMFSVLLRHAPNKLFI